jgi:Ca2+-binding EF-hand superfamily protein
MPPENRAMPCLSPTNFLVLVAAVVPTAALAAGEARQSQNPQFQERLLQMFDKNGNGQLDPEERQAAKEEFQKRQGEAGGTGGFFGTKEPNPEGMKWILERFDSNKDGKLDETERAAAKAEWEKRRSASPERGPVSEKVREEMLKRFDRDGDGKLSDAERAAAKEEWQKRRQEK